MLSPEVAADFRKKCGILESSVPFTQSKMNFLDFFSNLVIFFVCRIFPNSRQGLH
jgi:hypothetical protein